MLRTRRSINGGTKSVLETELNDFLNSYAFFLHEWIQVWYDKKWVSSNENEKTWGPKWKEILDYLYDNNVVYFKIVTILGDEIEYDWAKKHSSHLWRMKNNKIEYKSK